MNGENTLDSIPLDLFHDIFSRLPTKSVGKCCCVSKQWKYILSRQDFTELFLTRSSTRPRLLFASKRPNDGWCFFSSPHPQNPYGESILVSVDVHTKFYKIGGDCIYAYGLFYLSDVRISNNKDDNSVPVIYNPLTGRYAILPKLKMDRKSITYFGFDPIYKQFKVVLMNNIVNNETVHHILTLGAKNMRWRKIQCPFTHYPLRDGICIDGVLYYLAHPTGEGSYVIVCFDVRSEKFKYIRTKYFHQLINYKGKLGGVTLKYDNGNDSEWPYYSSSVWRTRELYMSVLEDVEKKEWSECVFPFPDAGFCNRLSVVGITSTGEIVLCETKSKSYAIYFSPERNTFQHVKFQRGGASFDEVYAFVDHIDDLSVNDAKQLNSSIYDLRILESFKSIKQI